MSVDAIADLVDWLHDYRAHVQLVIPNNPTIEHVPEVPQPMVARTGSIPYLDPLPQPTVTGTGSIPVHDVTGNVPRKPSGPTREQFERLLQFLHLPSEARDFFLAALESPQDQDLWGILADYLEEQGLPEASRKFRKLAKG